MKSIGDVSIDDIKICKSDACSFILLNSNVISEVLLSISVKLFFTLPNCSVTSSTVLFIFLINVSCNLSRWSFKDFRNASDLQTFLSLPHLISKANDEEKNVEKLGSESKLDRKSLTFTARIDDN
jgi:hypothetical protein